MHRCWTFVVIRQSYSTCHNDAATRCCCWQASKQTNKCREQCRNCAVLCQSHIATIVSTGGRCELHKMQRSSCYNTTTGELVHHCIVRTYCVRSMRGISESTKCNKPATRRHPSRYKIPKCICTRASSISCSKIKDDDNDNALSFYGMPLLQIKFRYIIFDMHVAYVFECVCVCPNTSTDRDTRHNPSNEKLGPHSRC